MKTLLDKFSEEHRVAFEKLTSIQNSTDSTEQKAEEVIKLYEIELIPHFKEEEVKIFPFHKDATSDELLLEHKQALVLINKIKESKDQADIDEFIKLMKAHIVKEDKYFAKLTIDKDYTPHIIIGVIIVVIILIVLFAKP